MWPLLGCSILILTVIVERSLFWLGVRRRRNRKLVDRVLHLAESGQWDHIGELVRHSEDHVVRVLVAGILHRHYDMTRAMKAEASHMVRRMSRSR